VKCSPVDRGPQGISFSLASATRMANYKETRVNQELSDDMPGEKAGGSPSQSDAPRITLDKPIAKGCSAIS
jgi:hypothetical protein